MKTVNLKRRKQQDAPAFAAATLRTSILGALGGTYKGASPVQPLKRRPCSLAFDAASGVYRWTVQEKRS